MIDHRADSILYQSQTYLIDEIDKLITSKKLGKVLDAKWDKLDLLVHYNEVYQLRDNLEDPDTVNYALNCLINIANLYEYPVAPTMMTAPQPVIVGIPGPPGGQGPAGANGATGMATDRSTVTSSTAIVDSFPLASAEGARWDYIVRESAGAQRTGSVIGTWSPSGLDIEFFDSSSDDIIASTLPISFDVQFDGTNINLVAVITSGTWTVKLTRYFIPNNGNGSGPVSDSLGHNLIWIGNSLNLAQARNVSGDITITDDGTVAIAPLVIINGDISNTAAISVSKLQALTPFKAVITNNLGFLTTTTFVSGADLEHVAGATSNIQGQINNRLIDPTTNIGDMIIRDGTNTVTRLPIGTTGQVLTVAGGIPTWLDPAGVVGTFTTDIGDWDMFNTATTTVTLVGVPANTLRSVTGVIRPDVGSVLGDIYYPIGTFGATNAAGSKPELYILAWYASGGNTIITLGRVDGSQFQSLPSFGDLSYNRGWLVITYVP